jgi:hypothetical protein
MPARTPSARLGREGGDARVHAVLHVQHLDRVASALQPLEQAGVVAVLRGTRRDDGGRQLLRVADQECLVDGERRGGVDTTLSGGPV